MPHFASMSQVIDWILIYWLRGNILKERLSIILFWFEKLNDVTYESLATMHWNNGYTMFFYWEQRHWVLSELKPFMCGCIWTMQIHYTNFSYVIILYNP